MVLTKAQKSQILEHVLDVIFDEEPDSDMRKVISYNKFRSTHDIITMDDEDFPLLQFQDDKGNLHGIHKSDAGLLKMFKAFVAYRNITNNPIDDSDWLSLTQGEFDHFWVSSVGVPVVPPSVPTPCAPVQHTMDLVQDFRHGIKHDATQFTPFKDDAVWDNWNQGTLAQARAQDVDDVLNPSYTPAMADEIALFEEKQKYMHAVFEKTLLMDKGKALV
jgi:hypothetical protein